LAFGGAREALALRMPLETDWPGGTTPIVAWHEVREKAPF
jgi:hypothetical protein